MAEMTPPKLQAAIIQTRDSSSSSSSSLLGVTYSAEVPVLPSSKHVLVRVLAVALNPTDFKMVAHFPQPDTNVPIGCDFCGVVEEGSSSALAAFPRGTRVCGGLFPYGRVSDSSETISGAFAEWLAADTSQLLKLPDSWDDMQGAAIGGICWGTCVLALFADSEALALEGRPSKPVKNNDPVIVYGGATATGTMACQLLKLSGYSPIAVTSTDSAPLAMDYGAVGTASYTSPTCSETIRSFARKPTAIHHALDCITSPESIAICFASLSRAGGRYACLETLRDEWRSRRAIRTRVVMGFEGFGHRVELGQNVYSREANMELYQQGNGWTKEMQTLLDQGLIKNHPVREVQGQWQGIIEGLGMLERGEVRGQKLVVRICQRH